MERNRFYWAQPISTLDGKPFPEFVPVKLKLDGTWMAWDLDGWSDEAQFFTMFKVHPVPMEPPFVQLNENTRLYPSEAEAREVAALDILPKKRD